MRSAVEWARMFKHGQTIPESLVLAIQREAIEACRQEIRDVHATYAAKNHDDSVRRITANDCFMALNKLLPPDRQGET